MNIDMTRRKGNGDKTIGISVSLTESTINEMDAILADPENEYGSKSAMLETAVKEHLHRRTCLACGYAENPQSAIYCGKCQALLAITPEDRELALARYLYIYPSDRTNDKFQIFVDLTPAEINRLLTDDDDRAIPRAKNIRKIEHAKYRKIIQETIQKSDK